MKENLVEQPNVKEIKMPDYVCLKEKYKCKKCIFNNKNRNKRYKYGFPHNIKYMFSTCKANPYKRTQCKKRCWFISNLFTLSTGAIVVIAFIVIFSHLQSLMLSLVYIVPVIVILDIICCIIEYLVDKTFEGIEKLRRYNYDKKAENIEKVNKEKEKEKQRQKEKEKELYKDIENAKKVFADLSSQYLSKMKEINKSDNFLEIKKEVYKKYKELLKNVDSLLKKITLENFYLSEVRTFFEVYLPKLCEYITNYAENENETEEQIEQLNKLIESFNTKVTQIKENLDKSEVECLIYKMQALREVISGTKNEQED